MELAEERWTYIAPLLPNPTSQADGRGRPLRHPRVVLDGILQILRNGAPWIDLPIAARTSFDSPSEFPLVGEILDAGFLDVVPKVPIGDTAHDSSKRNERCLETRNVKDDIAQPTTTEGQDTEWQLRESPRAS